VNGRRHGDWAATTGNFYADRKRAKRSPSPTIVLRRAPSPVILDPSLLFSQILNSHPIQPAQTQTRLQPTQSLTSTFYTHNPQIWRLENGVRHVPRVRARRITAHRNSTSSHVLTAMQQTTKSRRAARLNPLPSPNLLPAAASLKMRKKIAMCVSPRYPALHNFAPPCTKDAHSDYNYRS
jgi:hypothetical protein